MPDSHLPHTPFPDDRRPVEAVTPVHARAARANEEPRMPSEGRMLRLRTLPRAEAEAQVRSWLAGGARTLPGPEGVVVVERTRPDTLSGLRRQRLAVGAGDPAPLVNWSALEPLGRDDEAVWSAAVTDLPRTVPAARNPHLGWTA